MKVFFKIKLAIRKQYMTIVDFFEAYKRSKKLLNQLITFKEYESIILTLNPKELITNINQSWEVFELSSDERMDYA
jgi:hypothetical protein